jgi:WD40 repeat protein
MVIIKSKSIIKLLFCLLIGLSVQASSNNAKANSGQNVACGGWSVVSQQKSDTVLVFDSSMSGLYTAKHIRESTNQIAQKHELQQTHIRDLLAKLSDVRRAERSVAHKEKIDRESFAAIVTGLALQHSDLNNIIFACLSSDLANWGWRSKYLECLPIATHEPERIYSINDGSSSRRHFIYRGPTSWKTQYFVDGEKVECAVEGEHITACCLGNGGHIAFGYFDGNISTFGGKLTGHMSPITELSFSPNCGKLASKSYDRNVHVWNLTQEPSVSLIKLAAISSFAFSPSSEQFASSSRPEGFSKVPITLWDMTVAPPRCTATLERHRFEVTALAYSPDGKQLASGAENGNVLLWDLTTKPPVCTAKLSTHGALDMIRHFRVNPVVHIAYSPLEGQLACTQVCLSTTLRNMLRGNAQQTKMDNATVRVWDITGEQPACITTLMDSTPRKNQTIPVAYTRDGGLQIGKGDKIYLWQPSILAKMRISVLKGSINKTVELLARSKMPTPGQHLQ